MYIMFLKKETLIVIGQLFLIVILALWLSTTSIFPSLVNTSQEGFHQMVANPLEYTTVSSPEKAFDDIYSLRAISPDSEQCKKVSGFPGYGVFCTPTSPAEKVDIYSHAKGDLTCESVGLYNSKGPLCLDDNMRKMLQTRGANAQGGFGQIGSA
jgi:hypothetical protein